MKRMLLTMMLIVFSVSIGLAGTYSGGSGTSGDPYQISNTDDLIELSNTSGDWGDYFEQTANISFNADETQVDWDGDGSSGPAEGFSPIGNVAPYFTGSYDGGGYTIDNLYINRSTTDYVGLFGYTNGSSITAIGVTNVNITGSQHVGGLVGYNRISVTVSNCYSTGSVTGVWYAGGLVGRNDGTVSNSYSTGSVSGDHYTGGLVGINDGTVSNSYSTGSVTGGGNFVGGLVGFSFNSNVSNSFWDTETSGQSSSDGGTGKTTTEMQNVATFTSTSTTGLSSAWDFETNPNDDAADNDYWDMDQSGSINSGYPFLSWENGTDTSLPVELAAFTAENQSGGVLLTWTTESEIENLGFIIGRRKTEDGEWKQAADYRTDKSLAGHGSTTRRHDYGYTDTQVQPGATYEYRLGDVDYSGSVTWHAAVEITVPDADAAIPAAFGLQKAYPNPFNPAVTLQYDLTRDAKTTLQVYNMRGQRVETLVSKFQTAGSYDYTWQPQNLSTGVYVIRLQSGNQTNLQKVVFVK